MPPNLNELPPCMQCPNFNYESRNAMQEVSQGLEDIALAGPEHEVIARGLIKHLESRTPDLPQCVTGGPRLVPVPLEKGKAQTYLRECGIIASVIFIGKDTIETVTPLE